MPVREQLELDFSRAFRDARTLDEALSSAAGRFSQGIARAMSQVASTKVPVDASGVNQLAAGAAKAKTELGQAKEQAGQLGFSLKRAAEVAAGLGLAVGAREVLRFFKDSVLAASDLAESMSKARVVFGDSADEVLKIGENSAQALGLSRQAAIETAATFGNLFTSMGLSRREAAGMSTEMVRLGADLASFNNIPVEEALVAIRAGLVGEIEPLRRLGVSFNAAQVEAKAMELGLVDANGEVTEAGKVQARYAIVLEQTKNAQGDFARTSDFLANTLRTLKAEVTNAQATLGEELLPDILKLTTVSLELLPALTDLAKGGFGAVGVAIQGLLPFMQAFGAILSALPPGISSAAISAVTFGKAFQFIAQNAGFSEAQTRNFSRAVAGLAGAAAIFREIGGAAAETASQVLSSAASGALMGAAFGPQGAGIGALAGTFLGLAKEIGLFGESAAEAAQRTKDLAAELEGLGALRAAEVFFESLGGDIGALEDELTRLAATSPAAAQRVVEGLSRIGVDTDKLNRLLKEGTKDFTESNKKKQEAGEVNRLLAGTSNELTGATVKLTDAQKEAKQQLEAFVNTALGQLPAAGQALTTVEGQLGSFGLSLATAGQQGLDAFAANLQAKLDSIAQFPITLQALVGRGLEDLAAFLATQGPETTAPLITAINNAGPEAAVAIDSLLGQFPIKTGELQAFLESNAPVLTGQIVNPFDAAIPGVGGATTEAMQAAAAAIFGGGPKIKGNASGAAGEGVTGFGEGLAPMPGQAGEAVGAAGGQILVSGSALAQNARNVGEGVGANLSAGIAAGVSGSAYLISLAATGAVLTALGAARRALGIRSPSAVASKEIGLPIAQGTAEGITKGSPLVIRAQQNLVGDAMNVGTLTRAFSGALSGASLGAVTVIKVGSMDEALAFLPASVRSNRVFLEG